MELRGRRSAIAACGLVAVALQTACTESSTAPTALASGKLPTSISRQLVEQCQDITFENLAHGTVITNQLSIFGTALTVSAVAYDASGAAAGNQARIYAGGTHTAGPDFDLQSTGAGALCANCTSNMLVVQQIADAQGAIEGGATSDNQWGGEITFTGLPANTFYIKSFQLADH